MKNIVWISAYPKSGNTWIRLLINSLIYGNRYDESLDKNIKVTGSDVSKKLYGRLLNSVPSEVEFSKGRAAYIKSLSNEIQNSTLFLKTHTVNAQVDGVSQFDHESTSAVILVIRNVFDAVCSAMNHFGLTVNEAIEMFSTSSTVIQPDDGKYLSAISDWGNFNNSWISEKDKTDLFVVRYEDLMLKPFSTVQRMSSFLGYRKSEREIIDAINANDFKAIQKAEEQHGFAEASVKAQRFFNKGEIGYYKGILSPEEEMRLYTRFEKELKAFGYDYNPDTKQLKLLPIKHEFKVQQ